MQLGEMHFLLLQIGKYQLAKNENFKLDYVQIIHKKFEKPKIIF